MIQDAINKAYAQMKERKWNRIYWAIDLHGTCFKCNYVPRTYEWFNDDVVETLKYIQSLPESEIILWSSCYHNEQVNIIEFFKANGINIGYFNQNPYILNTLSGCFNQKFYFSILVDDKAGFDPDTDWKIIKDTLLTIKNNNNEI